LGPSEGRVDRLQLASIDFLGDPRELEARARQAMAEAGIEEQQASGPLEGCDPTETVWITVDRRARVTSVEINRRWKDQLDAGSLGQAVYQAYQAATMRAFNAAAVADIADGDGTDSSVDSGSDVLVSTAPSPNGGDWMAEIRVALDRVDSKLRAVDQLERAAQTGEGETTVASPNGFFALRLLGEQLIGVNADIMLIRRLDAEQLRLELLDVFRTARLTGDG
jgi:hypothetical protein